MAKQPIFFVLMLSYFLLTAHFSWAGNAKLIEKRVEQLDQLNKNIVAKIPKLPKKGYVAVNANIGYTKRSITYKKYNAETSQIKEGTIHLIVAKIPKLPKKGHVAVNANIGYTKRSITYKKYNAGTSQIKERTILLDDNQKIINSETRGVKG